MQNGTRHLKQHFWRDQGITFLLITLFLCLVVYRYKHNLPSMSDFFRAYYPAGRLIIENPYALYDLSDTVVYGFVNLPILAYLFTPFSYLDKTVAGVSFTLLGITSVIFSIFILVDFTGLKSWRRLSLIAIMLFTIPISNSIWIGNTTHFTLLLLIGSFDSLKAKGEVLGGVLLAIASLIKLPLLFLMLLFVIRQRWRALLASCLTLLSAVTLSVVLCGWNLNLIWFQRCILSFSGKVVGAYNVQSVDSFLVRLLTAAPLNSWDMYEASWQLKLVRYSLFLLFIGGTFWTLFRSKHSTTPEAESLEFSIFLCLAIISSPISWTHYYLLLLLPISLLISLPWMTLHKRTWSAAIAVVILLISTPPVKNVSVSNPVVAAFIRNFLVSHYFWGGVLLLGILLMARWKSPQMLLEQQIHEG